ncbi:MAG: histidine phosphatase family protein [Salinibacter sp.]
MLYLLRHAESTVSPEAPESDWPLSETGKKQAEALVDRLAGCRIDAVYSSPYRRAVATVRPLAADRDLSIRSDDRLRERELTDRWLDDHMRALRRVWADFTLTLPGGESSTECQRRVKEALDDLRSRHDDDERVLVSSHGNAIGLYLNCLDWSFGFEEWTEMANPALFAVRGDQWRRVET